MQYFKLIKNSFKTLGIFLMVLLLGAPSCEDKILDRMRKVYRFDDNVERVCVVAAWPTSSSKHVSEKFTINSKTGADKFNASIESQLRKYKTTTKIKIISYSTLKKTPEQCADIYLQSDTNHYKKCIQAWANATKKIGTCKAANAKVITIGSYFNDNDILIYMLGAKQTFGEILKTKQGGNRSASATNVANRLKTYLVENK